MPRQITQSTDKRQTHCRTLVCESPFREYVRILFVRSNPRGNLGTTVLKRAQPSDSAEDFSCSRPILFPRAWTPTGRISTLFRPAPHLRLVIRIHQHRD